MMLLKVCWTIFPLANNFVSTKFCPSPHHHHAARPIAMRQLNLRFRLPDMLRMKRVLRDKQRRYTVEKQATKISRFPSDKNADKMLVNRMFCYSTGLT